ncbi:hypothetical protein ACO0RG_004242 [Hanseniaspora osmophila]|mgnify:CR=1 FL=1|uniref:Mitochondrial acidic protein MAM33 n=1 Tax=Hanseniaspora osmophila TaxID=56408 RepID=A0A1E5RB89_9ASCO|nr:Mitochondrial acidic protein MAM33 [Hanseniaspora osmophila]
MSKFLKSAKATSNLLRNSFISSVYTKPVVSTSSLMYLNGATGKTAKHNTNAKVWSRCFSSVNSVLFNENSKRVHDVLQSEIALEVEDPSVAELPEQLSQYMSNHKYEIVNRKPDASLVELLKSTDVENIHIFFDVSQIANLPSNFQNEAQSDLANGGSAASGSSDANAASGASEEMEFDEDELNEAFANVNVVVVKKSDNSAISMELLMNVMEGSFYIDSITPFKDSKIALDESADMEVKRDLLYHGPPFTNLDEELQDSLELYLQSRGIDSELANFVYEYADFQENNEYINWLKNMKSFFN